MNKILYLGVFLCLASAGVFYEAQSNSTRNEISVLAVEGYKYKEFSSNLRGYLSRPQEARKEITAIETKEVVRGAGQFKGKLVSLMSWLQENKVLYRHQVEKSYSQLVERMTSATSENFQNYNELFDSATLTHLEAVPVLKFDESVRQEFATRLKQLMAPLYLETVAVNKVADRKPDLSRVEAKRNLLNQLENMIERKSIAVNRNSNASSIAALVFVASVASMIGYLLANSKKKKTPDNNNVNIVLKKVFGNHTSPMALLDGRGETTWSNEAFKKLEFSKNKALDLINNGKDSNLEVDILDKSYKQTMTVLSFASGKTAYFFELTVVNDNKNRWTEHFVNTDEVETLLKGALKSDAKFKSFNEVVAETITKMNYLFKVSSKKVDLDLGTIKSECFVSQDKVQEMVQDFTRCVHSLVKDKERFSTIFIRTDEVGSSYQICSYIPNIDKSFLETIDGKRFLQTLSETEAKSGLYGNRLSLRFLKNDDIDGMDIRLSFENRSELETMIDQNMIQV